ncbi:hypothetical protein Leryth_009781 [Lithospermum erythrorhizon]|nr:hypothetical protein Leryth_009781 [Lithospermum erythrorhizon]
MRTLSCISLGLSLAFGCLLLALVVQFFYLFWWKKRVITNGGIEVGYSNPTRELFLALCWKKPSSLSTRRPLNFQEPQAQSDMEINLWDNPLGEEDIIDIELMNQEHISGPPRFLFTIEEETNEDLEAEDRKSRVEETPYLTPMASPSYFTPPLTPLRSSQNHQKIISLFELASDAEFNRIWSSPPPTFKFLRDAEEKLFRRKINEEVDKCAFKNEFIDARVPSSLIHPMDEENGSVITIGVHQHVLQCPSSSSETLQT